MYFVERYKERVEQFHTVKIPKDSKTRELYLQEDLALYLHDNGLTFFQEVKKGNGRLDFMCNVTGEQHYGCALECNNKPYIIEIKYYRNKKQIEGGILQLKRYMNRTNAFGCLLVYVDKASFKFEIENPYEDIKLLYVDLIEKIPSKSHISHESI